ncbi:MAG: glucodextranase DOMON-like domain-containing protein [Candidatus Hodarchaeales archaeon]|jgi:alpha-amylase/alpha-mannosidase (GH57 family)
MISKQLGLILLISFSFLTLVNLNDIPSIKEDLIGINEYSNFKKGELSDSTPSLLVNIIWHQHQPVYKNPTTGQYQLPKVMIHSAKDYKYMVDLVPNDINLTFDLTGSLLLQIKDYDNYSTNLPGTSDMLVEIAKMNESDMTFENKSAIWDFFFTVNPNFIASSGRFSELLIKRNNALTKEAGINSFNERDWRDLKGLFFLYWINFDYVDADPILTELKTYYNGVSTGNPTWSRPFTHDNISYIIDFCLDVTNEVIPAHKAAQDAGNVEIITSPLNHPILPLLIDLNSARNTQPWNTELPLPKNNTGWIEDARKQLELGNDLYQELFGIPQRGLWPSEEAVSPAIIPLVNQTGIEWLISDQQQLQKVLPELQSAPDSTTYDHLLYQPYIIEDNVSGNSTVTVYRNTDFSDRIGFSYSGMSPTQAAADFVGALKGIYDRFNQSTNSSIHDKQHLVSIALDGENAWEWYHYNNEFTGNTFLEDFYKALQAAQNEGWMTTITMTQYLDQFGTSEMTKITVDRDTWTGSWVTGELNTWIGEEDENIAWDWLINARSALVQAEIDNPGNNYSETWKILYQAEGSDWFWWYGADQNWIDETFDWIYKQLLKGIYLGIGLTEQELLQEHPYLFVRLKPTVQPIITGYVDVILNGIVDPDEWSLGAFYDDSLSTEENNLIDSIYTGYTKEGRNFFLRIDPAPSIDLNSESNLFIGIYLTRPSEENTNIFTRYESLQGENINPLGINLVSEIGINFTGSSTNSFTLSFADGSEKWVENQSYSTIGIDEIIEISIPFADLGLKPSNTVQLNVIAASGSPLIEKDRAPSDASWKLVVPSGTITGEVIFKISDTKGDDSIDNPLNNDGTLSQLKYPLNDIFNPYWGHFDLLNYTVAADDSTKQGIFQMEFDKLIVETSWNTPTFTLQYTHIYVDVDNITGSGRTDTINGAQVEIESEHAWEFMINVEGEVSNQYVLFANGTQFHNGVGAVGDIISKTISAMVSYEIIGRPSKNWSYAVIVGSKDYSWFRSINLDPAIWTGGGGEDHGWDPNVYDMLVPTGSDQKTLLNTYDASLEQYATILMVDINDGIDIEPVDNISPEIDLLNPDNGSIISSSTSLLFDIYDLESDINQVLYHWDESTNETLVSPYNIVSIPSEDGQHILYIYVEDTKGNWKVELFFFYVDSAFPAITLVSPANGSTIFSNATIQVNIDDYSMTNNWFAWDDNQNQTLNSPWQISPPDDEGWHILLVYANDTFGKLSTAQFKFFIASDETTTTPTVPTTPTTPTSSVLTSSTESTTSKSDTSEPSSGFEILFIFMSLVTIFLLRRKK